MGLSHVQRLEHIRTLLRSRNKVDAEQTRLLCFSGAGFTPELLNLAERDSEVGLIDLHRLYAGE
jgi:hypothetical protein